MVGTGELGHFSLRGELGRGGMGIVHEAWDDELHRRVAIKVLPEEIAKDADRRARFLREARSAAALTHPSIATIHQIGEIDGRLAIVMELVEGRSLRRLLAGGPLPAAELRRVGRAIAAALAAAHRAGIAHRDLKPENVMVSDEAVKLLDFGIAKAVGVAGEGGDALSTGLTATGQVVGTAGYMAPEQATGDPVDQRADVFAFGVVLFEMLSGELPFTGPTPLSRVIAVTRDPPRDLVALAPHVDAALAAVVARCLQKDPGARYPDGAALVGALEAAFEGSAVGSADGGRHASARRVVEPAAAAVAPTELAPRVAAVTSVGDTMGHVATDLGDDVLPRRPRWPMALVALAFAAPVAIGGVVVAMRSDGSTRITVGLARGSSTSTRSLSSAAPTADPGAPDFALAFPCGSKDGAPFEGTCSRETVAWCDPQWAQVACCGPGLVPVGNDGACGCPPHGPTHHGASAPGCPRPSGEKQNPNDALKPPLLASRPTLLRCFATELSADPTLSGELSIAVRVAPDGRVFGARIARATFAAPSAQTCLLDAYRRMRFPDLRGALGYQFEDPITLREGAVDFVQDGEGVGRPVVTE